MPHIIIEFSANVEPDVDMSALCKSLLDTATTIDAFPNPGIRVRASQVDHYAIADGDPKHGFIDISVRLRGGRSLEVRKQAVAQLFESAKQELAPVMAKRPLALSMEMRDIDPELSPKLSTIRDHLEGS